VKTFSYTAYTAEGRRRTGIVVAIDIADASSRISAQGLLPADIAERSAGGRGGGLIGRAGRPRQSRIGRDLLAVFTRQMAVLLGAGLAAEAALESVQTASPSRQMQSLAAQARARLLEGEPLSRALAQASRDLPPYYTAALQAAEQSGELGAVFATLADYLESGASDRAQLASALIYPAFVTLMAIGVCSVLMSTVVPEIVAMFKHAGRPLPTLTVVVLAIVDLIRRDWLLILAAGAGLAALVVAAARIPSWRRRRDRLLLRLPLLGRFMRLASSAQYLRTLALVINSRLPLTEALHHASAVLAIADHRDQALAAGAALNRGESLSRALRALDFLHPVARQLIEVGEQSARLGPMSERAAVLAETWLASERKRVIVLMEPLSMIVVGALVLAIILSVLLPIFDMQRLVGG